MIAFAPVRMAKRPTPDAPPVRLCTCGPGVICQECKTYGVHHSARIKPFDAPKAHLDRHHGAVVADQQTLDHLLAEYKALLEELEKYPKFTSHRKVVRLRLKRLRGKMERRGMQWDGEQWILPEPPPPEPDPEHASVATLYAWHRKFAMIGDTSRRVGKVWPRRSLLILGKAYIRQYGKLPQDRALSSWNAMPSGKTILREFGSLGAFYWALTHEKTV